MRLLRCHPELVERRRAQRPFPRAKHDAGANTHVSEASTWGPLYQHLSRVRFPTPK